MKCFKCGEYGHFANKCKNGEGGSGMAMTGQGNATAQQATTPAQPQPQMMRIDDEEGAENGAAPADFDVDSVDWSRLGRNEACLCGSGKKFKNCHYGELRAAGKI